MLIKAEHIGIMVSDMDRSIAWYTEVLGLTLRRRVRLNEVTELAFLPIGDTEIELVHRSEVFSYPRDGIVNHVAFTVSDVGEALERLRTANVELLNDTPVFVERLGARIAFFRGPDGEKFELFAPAA